MVAAIPQAGRLLLAVSMSLLLKASIAMAHQDPVGDVHPSVQAENGLFAVYFTNNTEEGRKDRLAFRIIYSPTGQLLAPRHPVAEEAVPGRRDPQDGGKSYSMPPYHRQHFGRPYYLVQENKVRQRHKIPWTADTDIKGVHDMVVADGVMWILGSSSERGDLVLYHYPLESLDPPSEVELGKAETIWSFPVVGNLVVKNGVCYFAWCRPKDSSYDLVLSKWDGRSKDATDEVLVEGVDSNLSISMAAIDGKLCVAFHRSRDGNYPGYGVIETVIHSLD